MRLALAPFLITVLFCMSLAEVRISTMSTLNGNDQQALQVGFLLYDGYELLDAAGPMEMFAALANSINEDPAWAKKQKPVKVFTVSERQEVKSENVFTVKADYTFEDAPHIDLLVLPGGIGARAEIKNEKFMSFLKKRATDATTVLTVCTGSALLAKTGLLDGHDATSNKSVFEWVMSEGPKVTWRRKGRWVHSGKFWTSAGVSAGMDGALALIAYIRGAEAAKMVMEYTEYKWNKDPDDDPFCELYMGKGLCQ